MKPFITSIFCRVVSVTTVTENLSTVVKNQYTFGKINFFFPPTAVDHKFEKCHPHIHSQSAERKEKNLEDKLKDRTQLA